MNWSQELWMSLRAGESKSLGPVLSKSHMLNLFCGIMYVSNGVICCLPHDKGLQHGNESDIEEPFPDLGIP